MQQANYFLTAVFLLLVQGGHPSAQQLSTYQTLKNNIALRQQALRGQYAAAVAAAKDSLVKVAKAYVVDKICNEVFNEWYGTPWDFNGTTQVPREGGIACGYFVTTVLRDAGFNLPRVKWAQLAAEQIILKCCRDVKRFRNAPVEDAEAWLRTQEDGLYVTGLDCHVGFIMKQKGEVFFVHSSYYHRETGVMKEKLKGENPFNDSKYRVIGKVSDDNMIRNWLTGVRME